MSPVDPPPISWEFRRRTIACSLSLLRIMHEAISRYGADMDGVMIYLAVSCASVGGALSDLSLAANPPPAGPMPAKAFRGVSRRAIAASTGLPRETVRRKIAAFIERGELVAEGSRVRIPHLLLEDPRNLGFAKVMIQEFSRTAAQLGRILESAPPRRADGKSAGGARNLSFTRELMHQFGARAPDWTGSPSPPTGGSGDLVPKRHARRSPVFSSRTPAAQTLAASDALHGLR